MPMYYRFGSDFYSRLSEKDRNLNGLPFEFNRCRSKIDLRTVGQLKTNPQCLLGEPNPRFLK